MPSLLILVPILILFVINIPDKDLRGRISHWLVGAWFTAQTIVGVLYPFNFWSSHDGLVGRFFNFNLSVDNLSVVMLITIGIVALVSLIVGISTITVERRGFHFTNLLLLSVIGMNATVMVRDIFSMYVFVEVTALSLFILIALEKGKLAIEGAFKYVMLSVIASVFMLTSIGLFLLMTGSTSFETIKEGFGNPENSLFIKLSAVLFLIGLLIKSGTVPFHGWVPDAYSAAPSSVSVLLAGIGTKISGVYVLLRLFGSIFVVDTSIHNVLLVIGAISIVFAAFAALTQTDFKRMLAYSSISQIGYIVLALGVATPLAFAGAIFHFFNHAIFKSLLFVNAASVEKRLGTTDMQKMAGSGSRMQVTSVSSLVALLSVAGIPPLSGFWSKLVIIIALFMAHLYVYAAIALLASALTLAYFLSLERKVFFGKDEKPSVEIPKATFGISFCEVLLTVITIGAGLGFAFIINTYLLPLKEIL